MGLMNDRLQWLWSQYVWHASRCNAPEMARRPWHRKQAEWYYNKMQKEEKTRGQVGWHHEPAGLYIGRR